MGKRGTPHGYIPSYDKDIYKELQKAVGHLAEIVVQLKRFNDRGEEAGCDRHTDNVGRAEFDSPAPDQSIKIIGNMIEDGYGTSWPKKCGVCRQDTMVVVRPGDACCTNCDSDPSYEKPIKQVERIKKVMPE